VQSGRNGGDGAVERGNNTRGGERVFLSPGAPERKLLLREAMTENR